MLCASQYLPVPIALFLVRWFSPDGLGFICALFCGVLAGSARVSMAAVALLAHDHAAGMGTALRLVSSILSLDSRFVLLLRHSSRPLRRGVGHASWFHIILHQQCRVLAGHVA